MAISLHGDQQFRLTNHKKDHLEAESIGSSLATAQSGVRGFTMFMGTGMTTKPTFPGAMLKKIGLSTLLDPLNFDAPSGRLSPRSAHRSDGSTEQVKDC